MPSVDRNSQSVELTSPHLWWVLRGTLHLTVHDGPAHRTLPVAAGTAVSVDRGVRISVRRSTDATALGFAVPEDATLPFTPDDPVTCGDIADEQHSALIGLFADSLYYLSTPSGAGDATGAAAASRPRMPVDPAARAAARLILGDAGAASPAGPAVPAGPGGPSIAALADAVFVSPSTLNRRFLAETGLTVGGWRARLRVSRATGLLAAGHPVEATAHRVGLSSASALCRLVRRHTGMTPGQFRDRSGTAPEKRDREVAPPTLTTWPRVNRFHVLLWAWRGTCCVTVGDTATDLREGELIWLPAGLPNHVDMAPGALVLPVGARAGRPAGEPVPTVVTREDAADPDALLSALGREYDPVDPEQTSLVDRLFYGFLTGEVDTHGSHLLRRLTDDFRHHPGVDRTLAQWADRLDCTTAELTGALALFGATGVRQWSARVRMVSARHLLASGIPVGEVARYLGYSGTASFSHVFRRAHGVSPGAWHGYV